MTDAPSACPRPVAPGGETAGVNRVFFVRWAEGAVAARELDDDGMTVGETRLRACELVSLVRERECVPDVWVWVVSTVW